MQPAAILPEAFGFTVPTQILFGVGVSEGIADQVRSAGGSRPLIVSERGVIGAGIVEPIAARLKEAGLETAIYDRFSPNPQDFEVAGGLEAAQEHQADVLIGIGGGSSMDMAKMIGVLMTNGGEAVDYAGFDLVKNPLPPLIVLPTTSGTGSEVTFCAVVTDNKKRAKIAPVSTFLAPKIALMDPSLTCSMPKAITVATGLDAFCHAFESYTCALANPLTEALAASAMGLVGRYLDVAVQDGDNLEARAFLQIASTMAGVAFTNSDCCGVHCMSESYGGMVDMPHGVACAVFLPPVFAFNMEADPIKHAKVGEILGLDVGGASPAEGAAVTLEHLVQWQRELGVPRLSEIPGVDPKDFDQAAQGATENLAAGSQPRPTTVEDYRRMFDEAYKA